MHMLDIKDELRTIMKNKPVIIQSLWIGNKLSKLEQLCIESFLYHNHEFHLYTYGPIEGIPGKTTIKDANEIIPEKEIFLWRNTSYAAFSDWFRWELLYQKGNYWVDTDVIALKHFDFKESIVFANQEENSIAPGVLKFPAKHDFCKFMSDTCCSPFNPLPYDSTKVKFKKFIKKYILLKNRGDIHWGFAGGPVGFTNAVRYFELNKHSKPFTYFYPIHYSNWHTIFDDTFKNDTMPIFHDCYAIHFWNEMISRSNAMGNGLRIDKNQDFPKDSLIEHLKQKYHQNEG